MFVRKSNILVREVACCLTAEDNFRLSVGQSLHDDASLRALPRSESAPFQISLVGGKEYDRLFMARQEIVKNNVRSIQSGNTMPISSRAEQDEALERLNQYAKQVNDLWRAALSTATYHWYDEHGDLTPNQPEMASALEQIVIGHDALHRSDRGVYYVAGASLEQSVRSGRKCGRLQLFLGLQHSLEYGLVAIESKDLPDDLRLRITIHPSVKLSANRLRFFDFYLEHQLFEMHRSEAPVASKVTVYAYKNIRPLTYGNQAGSRFEYRLSEAEEIGSGFQHQYSIRTLEIEDEPILRPIL